MSPNQVVAVAVRLLAIWLAVHFVFAIPVYYTQVSAQTGPGVSFTFYTGIAVLAILLLFVMWRFPMTIAGKLLTPTAREPASSASPDLWLAMGCALIGLWLLASILPWLVQDLMLYRDGFISGDPELKIKLAKYLPEIAISLWLIFGAKGFRKLFWWARNASHGQPKNERKT